MNAVVRAALSVVLDGEVEGIGVEVRDGTIFLDIDRDGAAFGLTTAPFPEDAAEMCVRYIESLNENVPETRRYWGRATPLCPVSGHSHAASYAVSVDGLAIDVTCPVSGVHRRVPISAGPSDWVLGSTPWPHTDA